MTQLITGGSGYLGVALARKLEQQGETVRVFDLERSPLLPGKIEFVKGDVRDPAGLQDALNDCTVVHHLVGIMPQARASRETMQAVNVDGTSHVLQAASDNGVKRIVFVSSSEVYGRPQRIPINEDDPLKPIGEYGRNKVTAEKLCLDHRGRTGLETVILRPPTIVGPEMTERTFLRNMEMARQGRFFCIGSGKHRFQMLHVDDAADACVLASQRKDVDGEIFNVGAEGTLPFKRQLEEVARHIGHKPKVHSIPAGLFKGIMKILCPLGFSPLEPDHLHLLYADFVMDISRAREKLGWTPTKTDLEMLIETYEWYVSTL